MNFQTLTFTPRTLLTATALLLIVFLAFPSGSVSAGTQVPFKAAFDTQFQYEFVPPSFLHLSITGEGQALHMGRTTAATTNQVVDISTGASSATYTLTAANGDTVVLELEFVATPAPVTFSGSYTVTGGTGRFAAASGAGSLIGSATITSGSEGFGQFSVAGTISSPRGGK